MGKLPQYLAAMVWKRNRPATAGQRWPEFVTPEEQVKLDKAAEAKRRWQKLNAERVLIVRRAIKRAEKDARERADRDDDSDARR